MSAKFASLHAGLLARKGEAAPAIPSPLGQVSYVDTGPAAGNDTERRDIEPTSERPLFRAKPADTPPLGEASSAPLPEAAPPTMPEGCCGGAPLADFAARPAAVHDVLDYRAEVRLSAEQKRRLRTVAAQMDWSQQRILSEALDTWLDQLSETAMKSCACLRARQEG